jgi:hypothetical protein
MHSGVYVLKRDAHWRAALQHGTLVSVCLQMCVRGFACVCNYEVEGREGVVRVTRITLNKVNK